VQYLHTNSQAKISIYVNPSFPRLYYSPQAPVFCAYEEEHWNEYSLVDQNIEYVSQCKAVERDWYEEVHVDSKGGDALGASRIVRAIFLEDVTMVITWDISFEDIEVELDKYIDLYNDSKNLCEDIALNNL